MSTPPADPNLPVNPQTDPIVDRNLSAMLHEGKKSPATKPGKKRRIWLKLFGILFLLIVLLIVLAPTLLSTGPMRSVVVGQVNNNINGSIEIADYSLGWFSGISAQGIKVYDARKTLMLSVPSMQTKLSLSDAIRGNLDLGDTRIDVMLDHVTIDENGNSNLASLAKADPTVAHKPSAPKSSGSDVIDTPNVRGKLTLNILGGSISGAGVPAPITIEPSSVLLDIPDINQPITNDIELRYKLGSAASSAIIAKGTVSAVTGGKIDLATIDSTLKAQQTVTLNNVDLGAATPVVKKSAGPDAEVGGLANGSLKIQVAGVSDISADGLITIDRAVYAGAGLKDRLLLDKVSIPVQVTRTANQTIKIEKLAIDSSLVKLTVTGEIPQKAIENLANNQPPGAAGLVNIDLSVPDFGALTRALPNTIPLEKDVTDVRGSLSAKQIITIANESVSSNQTLNLSAQAMRAGKRIELKPVTLVTKATAVPNGKPMPKLSALALDLTSDFATIKGGGESLAKIDVNGNFDLEKLRSELAQFVEMGDVQLAGTGQLTATTRGDPTTNAPIDADVKLDITNLRVRDAAAQSIDQPRIALAATGKIVLDERSSATRIDNAHVTFQAGDVAKPVVNLDVLANVDLATKSVTSFDLTQVAVDLPKAQQQFGGFVAALQEQEIRLESGALYVAGSGKIEGTTITFDEKKPLGFSIPGLAMKRQGRTVIAREDVQGAIAGRIELGKAIGTHFTQLRIDTKSKLFDIHKSKEPFDMKVAGSAISGGGELSVAADLKRLSDIAQAFSGPPDAASTSGQLRSGSIDGLLKLASSKTGTEITFDGKATNVSVTTAGKPIENETLTLALRANSLTDLSGIDPVNASVASRFANAYVSDAKIVLGKGAWAMIERAKVDVRVPELATTYALMQAFSPPAPPVPNEDGSPPVPPLAIDGGSVNAKLDINRKGNVTTIALNDLRASNVAIHRADQFYKFGEDVVVALLATLDTLDDPKLSAVQQISKLTVNELSGKLGVATLSMPKKIEASGLADMQKLVANGSIKLEGKTEDLVPLVAALQGAPPMPYGGAYGMTQTIATRSDGGNTIVSLNGETVMTNFVVFNGGQEAFTEKRITIKNDIDAFPQTRQLIARDVRLDMPESQAVGIQFSGQLDSWDNQRFITAIGGKSAGNAKLTLGYDLAKIWPIVRPMLSPDQQEQYKDLKIEGKYKEEFAIGGKYPANLPQPLKYLTADGALSLQLLDTSGITVSALRLPVKLEKGELKTLKATPATINGGKLDLSEVTLNVALDEMRINIAKNHKFVENMTMNPLLGDSLGKFINPMFANSQRAKGLINVTVNYCENLALGETMKTAQSGRAQIAMSITEMDIANPLGSMMFGEIASKLGNNSFQAFSKNQADTFQGELRDAVVTIEKGYTRPKGTFLLIDPSALAKDPKAKPVQMPLTFDGNVRMSDLTQSFNVSVPAELIGQFTNDSKFTRTLLQIFPSGIPLAWKGTTTKPQIELGDIGKKLIEGQLKNPEVIGDLLDKLGGKKDKDKKDEKPQPKKKK